ncbi:hypothetical protein EBO15_43365, partial [Actinomadura harenae]
VTATSSRPRSSASGVASPPRRDEAAAAPSQGGGSDVAGASGAAVGRVLGARPGNHLMASRPARYGGAARR